MTGLLTVGWGPTVNAMPPPQHPGDGDTGLLTVQFVARRGYTFYPYDAAGFAATQLPPAPPFVAAPPVSLPEAALAVAVPVAGLAVAAAVLAGRRRAAA